MGDSDSKDVKITRRKIEEYADDPNNANKGTQRGKKLINDSLQQAGAGRSLLADKHGRLIAGNKTREQLAALGYTEVIEIETSGDVPVVVRRTDLDLLDDEDNRGRLLAYMDNRTSQVGLSWDANQIAQDLEAGIDIGLMFDPGELAEIGIPDMVPDEDDPPAPGYGSQKAAEFFGIVVECANEEQQIALLKKLMDEGYTCRALLS